MGTFARLMTWNKNEVLGKLDSNFIVFVIVETNSGTVWLWLKINFLNKKIEINLMDEWDDEWN